MMDAVGIVERIVKLALATKNAADTVRQNKELCGEIRARAARVSALLSLLSAEPATVALMDEPAMRGALEDLEESLQRALELVAACQEERMAPACLLLCTAEKQSRRLRRVQDDISNNVMTVIFATNIQVTVVLTRNHPLPPSPRPPLNVEYTTDTLAGVDEEGGDSDEESVFESCSISEEDVKSDNMEQPPHPTPGSGINMIGEACSAGVTHNFGDHGYKAKSKANSVPKFHCWSSDLGTAPQSYVTYISGDHGYKAKSKANSVPKFGSWSSDLGIAPRSCLAKFNLSELDAATHHFSDDNLIGRGTLADVYKGELPKRLVVVVKKFH